MWSRPSFRTIAWMAPRCFELSLLLGGAGVTGVVVTVRVGAVGMGWCSGWTAVSDGTLSSSRLSANTMKFPSTQEPSARVMSAMASKAGRPLDRVTSLLGNEPGMRPRTSLLAHAEIAGEIALEYRTASSGGCPDRGPSSQSGPPESSRRPRVHSIEVAPMRTGGACKYRQRGGAFTQGGPHHGVACEELQRRVIDVRARVPSPDGSSPKNPARSTDHASPASARSGQGIPSEEGG